jgi:hypothetical protein
MKTPSHVTSKLKSLLALSAGAVAIPQAADAFYSGVINEQVGFSPGFGSSYTMDLPGTAALTINRADNGQGSYHFPSSDSYPAVPPTTQQVNVAGNSVVQIRRYPAAGAYFARRNSAGLTWDAIVDTVGSSARIGWRDLPGGTATPGNVNGPGSFTDKYIAFRFEDTDAGNALRYGWVGLSMTVDANTGPDVTVHGWAYDDSGEKIATGVVPEPSSVALTALGALALGGVRRWRASKRSS